jgi:hypothetical protein
MPIASSDLLCCHVLFFTQKRNDNEGKKKEKKSMDEALPHLKGRPKIKYKGQTWSPIKVHNTIKFHNDM